MTDVLDIYKIGNQMKNIHKKVELLNKKRSAFGLTLEEEEKLEKYLLESWVLHEELIETHLKITVFPHLLDKETNKLLSSIQKILPWNGGLIRRTEDYENVINRVLNVSSIEKEYIVNKLQLLHKQVLNNFESFCSTEQGYFHMMEASKVLSAEEDGNILDLLVYLDTMYRELAELLDIHLEEVEVMWEDDD